MEPFFAFSASSLLLCEAAVKFLIAKSQSLTAKSEQDE